MGKQDQKKPSTSAAKILGGIADRKDRRSHDKGRTCPSAPNCKCCK